MISTHLLEIGVLERSVGVAVDKARLGGVAARVGKPGVRVPHLHVLRALQQTLKQHVNLFSWGKWWGRRGCRYLVGFDGCRAPILW